MSCLRQLAGVLRFGCNKGNKNTGSLRYKGTRPGKAVKPGTELRVLCVGDSITVGFLSDQDGGDGNGYRLRLLDNLSREASPVPWTDRNGWLTGLITRTEDQVVYAGTESGGTMKDGYFVSPLAIYIPKPNNDPEEA